MGLQLGAGGTKLLCRLLSCAAEHARYRRSAGVGLSRKLGFRLFFFFYFLLICSFFIDFVVIYFYFKLF